MRYLICITLLLLGVSCQKYTIKNLPKESIHFGTKGGFSGTFREYILSLDNGVLLFKEQLPGSETVELQQIGKLKKQQLKTIVDGLEMVDFQQEHQASSNMNAMLAHHSGTDIKHLQWSSPEKAPSKNAQQLFEKLMQVAKQLRQ